MSERLRHLVAHSASAIQWTWPPLCLALGIRVTLFLVADVALRMTDAAQFHGPVAIWQRFDVSWYLTIVKNGYGYLPTGPQNVNFFPLFAILMWCAGHVTGLFLHHHAYLVGGMLVSWLAFAGANLVLYRLVADRFGATVAITAVLLLCVFPFGFYFGAAYTESLFLLCAVLAFYAAEHDMWWLASLAAACASASRPPGIFVGVAIVVAYLIDWLRTKHGWRWTVLWLALTPLGTVSYMFYCWVRFGNPLLYVKASKQGWGGGYLQSAGIRQAVVLLTHPAVWLKGTNFNNVLFGLYALLLVLFLLSLIPITRKLGVSYAVFSLLSMLAPVASFNSLTSTGRYLSIIFPTFVIGAYYLRNRPLLTQMIVVLSTTFLAVFTLLFVRNLPLY